MKPLSTTAFLLAAALFLSSCASDSFENPLSNLEMPDLDLPNLEIPKIGGSDEEADPAAAETEVEVEEIVGVESEPIERPKIAMRAGGESVALPYSWIEVEQTKPNAPADMTPVAGSDNAISSAPSSEPVSEQPVDEPAASPARFSWLKRLADRIEVQ